MTRGALLSSVLALVACGDGEKTRVTVTIRGCTEAEARLLVFAGAAACGEEDPRLTPSGSNEPLAVTAWVDPATTGPLAIDVPGPGPVAVVAQCRDGAGVVRQQGCGVQAGRAVQVQVAPVCSAWCETGAACPAGTEAWTDATGDICLGRCRDCAPEPDGGLDAGPPTDAGDDGSVPDGGGCEPLPAIPVAIPGQSLDLARLGGDRLLVAAGGAGGLQVLAGALTALVPTGEHDLSEAFGVGGSGDHAYVAEGSTAEAEQNLQVLEVGVDGTVSPPTGLVVSGEIHDVEAAGGYLYAAAGSAGLIIFSIATPASPTEAGSLGVDGDALDVALLGDRAIVAAGAAGAHVIDVTNRDSPALRSTHASAGARAVATDGISLVLVARGAAGVDVLELQGDTLVSLGTAPAAHEARGVEIAAGRAWVADGDAVLSVIDLAAPNESRPVPLPPGLPEDLAAEDVLVEGTWAVLAAGWNGLFVVDLGCAP